MWTILYRSLVCGYLRSDIIVSILNTTFKWQGHLELEYHTPGKTPMLKWI